MSGKSTLLRAIGLNVVLAQAGGPVCATGLRAAAAGALDEHARGRLAGAGVSYFMAELASAEAGGRRRPRQPRRRPCRAALLAGRDLQGTNTAERQIAARRIIHLLLPAGAIGAVSTHDLTLAEAPDLAAAGPRGPLDRDRSRRPGRPGDDLRLPSPAGHGPSTNALG